MKVLKTLLVFYLRLRVKNAHQLGSIDASGKVTF
jgi:hypothetical protein